MSVCYDIACDDCRVVCPDIGQTGHGGRYFYSDDQVYRFLGKHDGHRIRIVNELADNDPAENYTVDPTPHPLDRISEA
ncbi:MAG: hypothetical protein AB7L09_00905 [Nitrospira sp.]